MPADETHMPFCGYAVIGRLVGSAIRAEDPPHARISSQQPGVRAAVFVRSAVDAMADALGW